MIIDSRKELWLSRLLKIDSNWVDGDNIGVNRSDMTGDLVNDKVQLCFELKQDQSYNFPSPETYQINDLNTLSNRLKGYAKSANKKFRNYPNHRSVLIIETQLMQNIIEDIVLRLKQIYINNDLISVKYKNLYLSNDTKEIGAYLFCSYSENKVIYLKNPLADEKRIILLEELKHYLPLNFPLEVFIENK